MAGRDAVLSALGPRRGDRNPSVCSRSAGAIVRAMPAGGRFLCVSAAPVPERIDGDRPLYRLVGKRIVKTVFRAVYADLAAMEEQITRSALNWTILRPPRLTDKPRPSGYRLAYGRNIPGGYMLARTHLAQAMLRLIDQPDAARTAVALAY